MPVTIEKAQVVLPSDREVKVTRSFKAARPLVYRAFTEPTLVQRWLLGPPGWSMPVCEMDVRVGGRYRWRWRSDKDCSEFGFAGTFREVAPPARLVHTETDDPGSVSDAHDQSEFRLIGRRLSENLCPSRRHFLGQARIGTGTSNTTQLSVTVCTSLLLTRV